MVQFAHISYEKRLTCRFLLKIRILNNVNLFTVDSYRHMHTLCRLFLTLLIVLFRKSGGSTNTHSALQMARTKMFNESFQARFNYYDYYDVRSTYKIFIQYFYDEFFSFV